jgi:hypothetical protein
MPSVFLWVFFCHTTAEAQSLWNHEVAGNLSMPSIGSQGSEMLPFWAGARNASKVRGLVPLNATAFRGIHTIRIGFDLRRDTSVLPLEQALPTTIASQSGSVWVTITFHTAPDWNRSLAVERELQRSASLASRSPVLVPWQRPEEAWDALSVRNTSMRALSGEVSASTAADMLRGASHLPMADGLCHGLENAEARHNVSFPATPTYTGGASPFDSRRVAPGAVSVGFAGTGRRHIGQECLADSRNGSSSPWRLPDGASPVDAAFLIVVPGMPRALGLTQIELLDHAVYRPRAAVNQTATRRRGSLAL